MWKSDLWGLVDCGHGLGWGSRHSRNSGLRLSHRWLDSFKTRCKGRRRNTVTWTRRLKGALGTGSPFRRLLSLRFGCFWLSGRGGERWLAQHLFELALKILPARRTLGLRPGWPLRSRRGRWKSLDEGFRRIFPGFCFPESVLKFLMRTLLRLGHRLGDPNNEAAHHHQESQEIFHHS
jgi:hypothetical protein